MGTATVIYDEGVDKKAWFFECPTSEVNIDAEKKEVAIYREKGNWDIYELIDFDQIVEGDQMDLYITVGKKIQTEWNG